MMLYNGRTDLASEARELLSPEIGEKRGILAREEEIEGLHCTAVEVISEEGAAVLGKPQGKYFTLELGGHFQRGDESFEAAAQAVAELIRRCAGGRKIRRCLIAALGNPDITPDALGSLAAANIIVTRHLKSAAPQEFAGFIDTALCRTGVLGTTGVESAAQIRALTNMIKPELVIAIDALAGAELERLCRCVQVSSAGIAPGSGVGNDREELTRASLGVPVVALGVPTVIDAGSVAEADALRGMFVTPRNIDSAVRAAARVIGYGVNLALHAGLSVSDVDMLVG